MTTLARHSVDERFDRAALVVDRIVPLLLVVAVVCFAVHKIVAHDIWWQLATGEWILTNGFPSIDPFSYFAPNRPWIEMRWLYCVTLNLIYRSFGLNALILGKTVLLILTFGILWWFISGRPRWAASFGVACALAIAHTRFQIRPELVTYLLLVVTLLCVYRYRAEGNRRWIYPLLVVQVVWVNTHTLFVLGPAVLWIFVVCEWIEARLPLGLLSRHPTRLSMERLLPLVAVAALATAACVVNPYFLEGALFPLQLFREIRSGNVLSDVIDEFQSPLELAAPTYFFVSYLAVVAVSAASFWMNRRRASLSQLGIWAAFLYLSVLAQRNLSLFGIVAGLTVAANLKQADEADDIGGRLARGVPWAARAASLLFVLVMVPVVASDAYYRRTDTAKLFGFGVAEHRFPIRAMEFIRREGLPVPVLSSLGDGGYVLFEGGPKSVFVDGRLEVYGSEIIRDALKVLSTGEGVDALADRLGFATVVARYTREPGLLQTLAGSPEWTPVYYDECHVVLVRKNPATRELAERLRIDWQHPARRDVLVPPALAARDWLAGLWPKVAVSRDQTALGQLFVLMGNLAEAQKNLEEAVRRDPNEETACLYLGLIYRATGREMESTGLLARVGSGVLDRPSVQILGGSILELAGDAAGAVVSYQQAASLGEKSLSCYSALARAGLAAKRFDVVGDALLEIVKIIPNDPVAWNNLGVLATRTSAPQDAFRYFETSLRLNPKQPAVLNQIGVLRLQSGDSRGARESFTRALLVDPTYQPARENLKRVNGGQ